MSALREKEMLETIEGFKYTFKLKFGFEPYVSLGPKGTYTGVISLSELLGIFNVEISKSEFSEGILTRRRLKHIILYKHIFCKIARDIGYTNSEIGRKIKMNRVTILHAERSINDKVKIKDKETLECVDRIYNVIEKYILDRDKKV